MFSRVASSVLRSGARSFSTNSNGAKVAVLGASGGIGQPLSLLLKESPLVSELNLFDVQRTLGVAADLGHISTNAKVNGFVGQDQLVDAVRGCDAVVIPAGVPRKEGMTRDDLFNTNASIVKSLTEACAEACPNAALFIISNPVNATVPIVAETMKQKGVYDPRKLFGVTTLDVVRARTFLAELKGLNVDNIDVPVIGGHAGTTILPLLSQTGIELNEEEIAALTKRIQFGGEEVVKAKNSEGSATLSMAYAGAYMTFKVLEGLNGKKGNVECSYVESTITDSPFFSSKVEFGVNGIENIQDVGTLSAFEEESLKNDVIPQLIKSCEKGAAFVKN